MTLTNHREGPIGQSDPPPESQLGIPSVSLRMMATVAPLECPGPKAPEADPSGCLSTVGLTSVYVTPPSIEVGYTFDDNEDFSIKALEAAGLKELTAYLDPPTAEALLAGVHAQQGLSMTPWLLKIQYGMVLASNKQVAYRLVYEAACDVAPWNPLDRWMAYPLGVLTNGYGLLSCNLEQTSFSLNLKRAIEVLCRAGDSDAVASVEDDIQMHTKAASLSWVGPDFIGDSYVPDEEEEGPPGFITYAKANETGAFPLILFIDTHAPSPASEVGAPTPAVATGSAERHALLAVPPFPSMINSGLSKYFLRSTPAFDYIQRGQMYAGRTMYGTMEHLAAGQEALANLTNGGQSKALKHVQALGAALFGQLMLNVFSEGLFMAGLRPVVSLPANTFSMALLCLVDFSRFPASPSNRLYNLTCASWVKAARLYPQISELVAGEGMSGLAARVADNQLQGNDHGVLDNQGSFSILALHEELDFSGTQEALGRIALTATDSKIYASYYPQAGMNIPPTTWKSLFNGTLANAHLYVHPTILNTAVEILAKDSSTSPGIEYAMGTSYNAIEERGLICYSQRSYNATLLGRAFTSMIKEGRHVLDLGSIAGKGAVTALVASSRFGGITMHTQGRGANIPSFFHPLAYAAASSGLHSIVHGVAGATTGPVSQATIAATSAVERAGDIALVSGPAAMSRAYEPTSRFRRAATYAMCRSGLEGGADGSGLVGGGIAQQIPGVWDSERLIAYYLPHNTTHSRGTTDIASAILPAKGQGVAKLGQVSSKIAKALAVASSEEKSPARTALAAFSVLVGRAEKLANDPDFIIGARRNTNVTVLPADQVRKVVTKANVSVLVKEGAGIKQCAPRRYKELHGQFFAPLAAGARNVSNPSALGLNTLGVADAGEHAASLTGDELYALLYKALEATIASRKPKDTSGYVLSFDIVSRQFANKFESEASARGVPDPIIELTRSLFRVFSTFSPLGHGPVTIDLLGSVLGVDGGNEQMLPVSAQKLFVNHQEEELKKKVQDYNDMVAAREDTLNELGVEMNRLKGVNAKLRLDEGQALQQTVMADRTHNLALASLGKAAAYILSQYSSACRDELFMSGLRTVFVKVDPNNLFATIKDAKGDAIRGYCQKGNSNCGWLDVAFLFLMLPLDLDKSSVWKAVRQGEGTLFTQQAASSMREKTAMSKWRATLGKMEVTDEASVCYLTAAYVHWARWRHIDVAQQRHWFNSPLTAPILQAQGRLIDVGQDAQNHLYTNSTGEVLVKGTLELATGETVLRIHAKMGDQAVVLDGDRLRYRYASMVANGNWLIAREGEVCVATFEPHPLDLL